MALCDFCNDGATEATHTTTSGDRIVNMCYACMTAFTWGQSSAQSRVVSLPDANDAEDEIAEWCHWHGVPYDSVADFAVVQDDYERKKEATP
jgi:hypothetical protein